MASMTLTLPNAIKMKSGIATKTIEIDEMSGEEEDILADMTRDPGGKGTLAKSLPRRITEILSRTTVRIGDDWTRPEGRERWDLPSFFESPWASAKHGDRMFAMIRLRQLTLGDEYVFSCNCPTCKKLIKRVKVDLSKLEVKEVKLEVAALDTHTVQLPKSKDNVVWRFLLGTDEDYIEETIRTMKDQFISAILHRRIVSVNGAMPPGGLTYMKRMNGLDRRFLGMHFDATEGGIDTEIQITCDGCGAEFSHVINPGRPDFFFPSEAPSGSSSTSAVLPSAGDSPPALPSASPSPAAPG